MTPTPASGASVRVDRPAAEVFSFVSTPENDPLWVHGCRAIQRVTDEPIRVGSRLNEQLGFAGLRFRYQWEVTHLEPGHSITYTSRRGLLPMVITIAARPDGVASELTQDIRMQLPRLPPLGAAIGRLIARREARRNLAALQRVLEAAPRRRERDAGRPARGFASSVARRS